MLDQESLRRYETQCTQDSPPQCRINCPFSLDCRAFLTNMACGKLADARTILERHIPLPHIMALICDHPCEQACLRRDLGGPIALHHLEFSCLAQTTSSERLLPIPPKRHKMAVVGAGLAALTAAWDLSRKSYPVTLFVDGQIIDILLSKFPRLEKARIWLEEDVKVLLRKVCVEQKAVTREGISVLARDFAGVFLDACTYPDLAPAEEEVDASTWHWRDNICVAGWPTLSPTGNSYNLPSRQAGQGREAGLSMERVAGKLSLTAERKKHYGNLHTDCTQVQIARRLEPQTTQWGCALYSQEEASQEAGRCLQCQCLICVKNCPYLQKYKGYPKVYARQIHNNATIVKGLHTANKLINGCALCDQCSRLCPEHFSMAELCLAAREEMVDRGQMPPSAHEFALEDMEQAQSPESFLTWPEPNPGARPPHWLFFPGCQLSAVRGEQVLALFAWLERKLSCSDQPGLALVLACCGQPAHWAGQRKLFEEQLARIRDVWQKYGQPTILTACASCLAALREGLADLPVRSVWELVDSLELSDLPKAERSDLPRTFSVHDPCAARSDKEWQKAIRSLAQKLGYTLIEPKRTAETTSCCGYGGLVWCAQPETAKSLVADRIAQLPGEVLASCVMCRDRFVAQDKACWHILDLLLPQLAMAGNQRGPGLAQRRYQRIQLKARILGQTIRAEGEEIELASDLAEALEEKHILRSDIISALEQIEAKTLWCLNKTNNHRVGAWRPRKVTFWVEYSRTGRGFLVHDAWCHRMLVPGAGGEDAETVITREQSSSS
ncbi:MAG: 4Fe-4S dicluster domain-containing protein [Desulfovibrio sp.]|nr:4Fe-4S dicluster domain-containing protein [Desulfovibrio sp.]